MGRRKVSVRVECAAQEFADRLAEGAEFADAEYRVSRLFDLSDNERADMIDTYDEMGAF